MRVRVLSAVVLFAGCGDDIGPAAVPLRSGPATITLAEDGTQLVLTRDATTLLVLPVSGFQIGTVDDLDSGASFDPYWLFVDAPPAPPDGFAWHPARAARVLASSEQIMSLALDFDGGSGTLQLQRTTSGSFSAVFAVAEGARSGDPVAYLRVAADADATEGFYGLGEWGDRVEHRGTLRPMQLEVDLALESATNENHVPVPLVVGTRGWGLFAASQRPGVFDIARASDTRIDVAFGTGDASDQGLALHLFTADAALDVLRPYYEVAGYPGLPAQWAYGPLLWRDETESQAQMLDDIQQIRTLDLPASGVWFDRPYATGVNTFDWDPTKFPAPQTMLQALHDAGLRYALWQAPYVAPAGNDKDPAPVLSAYAEEQGYFPPVTGVQVNPWSKLIDFTNPDAYAWWKQNLETYTKTFGVEGFKLDYAEDVVLGLAGQRVPWRFADGSDERTMHHGYQLLYHQVHRETLTAAGGFLLTRTGRWGDQVHGTIIWPGDLDADLSHLGDPIAGEDTLAIGGLPTALAYSIGLSASGFPFFASDTGGYRRSPPNNETWLRWVEANAVSAAMQVGDSSSQMPWEFTTANGRTADSLDIYRRYTRLHLRLFPYAWSYGASIRATGHPIVRPVGLAYPELGEHPADEYLLGDFLLVAPVIAAGQTSRDVLFPPGVWLDWWTGAEQIGAAKRSVTADLATLPLYIERGGIVPMLRDTIDTLAPATMAGVDSFANDPGLLVVRVAPGTDLTTFRVYDGTIITQGAKATELTFAPGMRFKEGVLFEVIAVAAAPASVTNSGAPISERASYPALTAAADGWFYEAGATGGTLWIKVAGPAMLAVQ
jgi:alpha-D-xyloside xylohydrolase